VRVRHAGGRGKEQLFAVELDAVRDADVAEMATGSGGTDGLHHRLLRADCLDDRVGPSPPVSSLIFATPSSSRSSTMSVAPNSRASACRSAFRDIATRMPSEVGHLVDHP
jgi:hypothetical protein